MDLGDQYEIVVVALTSTKEEDQDEDEGSGSVSGGTQLYHNVTIITSEYIASSLILNLLKNCFVILPIIPTSYILLPHPPPQHIIFCILHTLEEQNSSPSPILTHCRAHPHPINLATSPNTLPHTQYALPLPNIVPLPNTLPPLNTLCPSPIYCPCLIHCPHSIHSASPQYTAHI